MSTINSRIPSQWGPKVTNKSYVLLMKDADYHDPVIPLPGFAVGTPDLQRQDAVTIRDFSYTGGYVVEREFYAKASFVRSSAFQINFLPGAVWTPIDQVANAGRRGGAPCKRDFFAVAKCTDDDARYAHFYAFPRSVLDESEQANELIVTTGDAVAVDRQAMLHTPRTNLYWALGVDEQQTDTEALYAIAFRFADCQSCPLDPHQLGVYGGGDGTGVPIYKSTDDRFATSSAISNSIPSGSIITDLFTNGNVIVATYADTIDPVTATTGGIAYSTDGGTTVSVASGITNALYGVTQGAGYYWAVGKDGVIVRARNLASWSTFTQTVFATPDALYKIAHDPNTNYLYVCGWTGADGVAGRINGNSITDISTDVNVTGKKLYDVAVLGNEGSAPIEDFNHVVFVGQAGTMRENEDAASGGTYTSVAVAATTDDLYFVGGDKIRTIVAGGTRVYERSPLYEDDTIFTALPVNPGTTVTGNIRGGATGETWEGASHFAFVTSTGEVIVVAPYTPDD